MPLLRWLGFYLVWGLLTAGFAFAIFAAVSGDGTGFLVALAMMYIGYHGTDRIGQHYE